MNGVLFALAAVVWLVAAYAFVRVALAWFGVMRMAPSGQRLAVGFDLGFWNFPAVQTRLGPAADSYIKSFRQGFTIFIVAIIGFMIVVILNIVTGTAA